MARPAEAYFLALDQGGHSSRALVFSATGEVITQAQKAVATHAPHPNWVEQDAQALVDSLRSVIADVHATLGRNAKHVRSAGLATQRSNCVCWDRRDGQALSPALSWQDRRAQRWLENLPLDDVWLRARTGLQRSPHYGASKLRWCLDHLPAVREAVAARRLACGPLASFLAANLLRERPLLIDPANAARTLLWNLSERDWDAELLQLFGIERDFLPRTVTDLLRLWHACLGRLVITIACVDRRSIRGCICRGPAASGYALHQSGYGRIPAAAGCRVGIAAGWCARQHRLCR